MLLKKEVYTVRQLTKLVAKVDVSVNDAPSPPGTNEGQMYRDVYHRKGRHWCFGVIRTIGGDSKISLMLCSA